MESNSSESLQDSNYHPNYLDEEAAADFNARRLSAGSSSALRKQMSAQSNASKYNEDPYPGMSKDEIGLRRTNTRATIVSMLAERAREEVADLNNATPDEALSQVYRDQTNENALPTRNEGAEFTDIDPELITWDSDDDPQNPRNWSTGKKWYMTAIVSAYSLISPFSSSMLSPGTAAISKSFGVTSVTVQALMTSIFILGLAFGPLLTAPISEMYGRRRVLNVSIWLLFFFNLGCSLSHTTAQMCVFRFLGGLFGSAPLSIGAGCLGDMFTDRDRNNAVAVYSLGPSVGPNASPIIAGFIIANKSLNWRWPIYVLCMFNGVVAIWGTLTLKETYAPQLLFEKAQKFRKETGNENLHTIYEVADGETVLGKFYINITRPLSLLMTHPMVFGLGAFMALVYGCLYVLIVTFPSTWEGTYGFSIGISGLMFVSILIGYIIGIIFFTLAIEKTYPKMIAKNNGVAKPEFRLPFLIASGITTPVGLFWYGWSVQAKVHWIMPCIGAAIFAFGIIAVFQTIQNYLIDMNPRFAASSIAAAAFFRSMMGFAFPLFIHQMIKGIGMGWTYTIFGFLGALFGIPFPIFVVYRGERLRLWANKKIEKKQAARDARNLERLQKNLQKSTPVTDEKASSNDSTS